MLEDDGLTVKEMDGRTDGTGSRLAHTEWVM